MDEFLRGFNESLQTGFVNKDVLSDLVYQPELLVNQRVPPKKVLSTILNELENCDEFCISVAFVTTSGVASIINTLESLRERQIKGRMLVSQYLNFTQPEALKKILQFGNIDLRIATKGNAHSKGYLFKRKEHLNLIIGSSNLTAQALATNKEWNLKISAIHESGIVEKVLNEFESDFKSGTKVTEQFIVEYNHIYLEQQLFNRDLSSSTSSEKRPLKTPNSMQLEALENLEQLRKENKQKALIISATGTGKTYLSAFDAQNYNAKKLLFVVHRLTIAKDALNTFKSVFGSKRKMGLYSGKKLELEADFLFSTVQTISKEEHLSNFSKNHFDYIIIDESHRSGANSYARLLEYFEPDFLLGMTATPERTDGTDIFQLFDHNIAYEIRLNRAMEEEMLSSFHYFGVTDLLINDIQSDNKSDFNSLVSDERVARIIEKSHFYGTDNGITRGLVFCSRKKEAVELSRLFNLRGFKTKSLTGDSSDEERTKAIELLESDDLNEKLDYIFTVDIFNEGIDIPKINQIIMIRPTESAIIFIQQLGRGLRKVEGKGYLTVIDFIGNYENNYLIPIALYGDTSYNKDSLRKLITEGSRMIPGSSTINFDEITKEQIFKSIDSANMQLFSDLKKDYFLLKFKLGRTPMMMDFIEHGSRDPYLFVNYSNSYYNFITKVEKEVTLELSKPQIKLLELFGKEINNSKRVEESLILLSLLEEGILTVESFRIKILETYNYTISEETIASCLFNLNFKFIREKKDGKLIAVGEIYELDIVKMENETFYFSSSFLKDLKNDKFREYLLDSTEYSISKYNELFENEKWQAGFVLYRKYSRKDVFRILNSPENPVAQNVGGYLVSSDNSNCPIFVNYHKEDDISESTKYEDEFVNPKEFNWMSKSNRKISSKDVQSILGKKGDIRLPLFIKKNNDEGQDFYFMGDVQPDLNCVEQTTIKNDSGRQISVVKIRFKLSIPVAENLYQYLHEKNPNKKTVGSSISNQNEIPRKESQIIQLKNPIPLYDFYAAAGSFSELQSEKKYTLIEGPENGNNDFFACKIVGESMNRVIPNGSICLFKTYGGGSRNGKIVLVENFDVQDQDFNSAFTIKTYSSEKIISDEGWQHTTIVLRPNSFDPSYENIEINEESGSSMRVVGEFVKVLK